MKIALLLFFTTLSAQAEPLRLQDSDKQKHLLYSAGITTGSYLVYRHGFKATKTQSLLLAIGTAFTLGLAKELTDSKFSSADMAANSLGISGGLVIPLIIEF